MSALFILKLARRRMMMSTSSFLKVSVPPQKQEVPDTDVTLREAPRSRHRPEWSTLDLRVSACGQRLRKLAGLNAGAVKPKIDKNDIAAILEQANRLLDLQRLQESASIPNKLIYIDALDVASSYGQATATPNFIGLFLAINALTKWGHPVRVCIFEDDMIWWETLHRSAWDLEEHFRQELRRHGILMVISRPVSSAGGFGLYLVRSQTGIPLSPLEVFNNLPQYTEKWTDVHVLGAALTASSLNRNLGEVEKLARLAGFVDAMLMCNDWKQFESLALINSDAFEYVCDNRCPYFFPTSASFALSRDNKGIYRAPVDQPVSISKATEFV